MTDLSHLSNDQLLALLAPPAPPSLGNPQPHQSASQGPSVTFQGAAGHVPYAAPPDPIGLGWTGANVGKAIGNWIGDHVIHQDPAKMSNDHLMAIVNGQNPKAPMSGAHEAALGVPQGFNKGAAGFGGMIGDTLNAGANAGTWLADRGANLMGAPSNLTPPQHVDFAKFAGFPTSQQVNQQVQQLAGQPYHVMQTEPGKFSETISSFLPAAALGGGGSIPQTIAGAVVPGAMSETAGQMAHGLGPGWESAARVAGGLGGAGAVGAVNSVLKAPDAAFGANIANVTPEQMDAAQTLRVNMANRGLNLTVPEAVQMVTNNGTGLGRMQRVLEGTREGNNTLAPYFSERPDQVRNVVMNYADTIAPQTDQPSMIGVRAQGAAEQSLSRARQIVNSVAGPDYAALQHQVMDPAEYQALAQQPSYKLALSALRDHPELGAPYASLPDNSLAVINAVKKRLGTMGEQAAGTAMLPGDNELAGLRYGAKGIADEAARASSPQYANANDTVAHLSQTYVDPLKAGPLGMISSVPDVPTQTGALYPANPLEGAGAETSKAVTLLNRTAPGTADDLTRQTLVNILNGSSRSLAGGPNQYVGAKFANLIAGNPEQETVLHAGVSALPDGGAKSGDLAEILQGLRATGRRQPPGSMTAFNSSDLGHYSASPTVKALESIDIAKPFEVVGEALKAANYKRNVNALLAKIIADPDKTAELLRKAQAAAPSNAGLLPSVIMNTSAASSARH